MPPVPDPSLDPSRLLPHSGISRLVTSVLSCHDGRVTATATIPARHPLCTEGRAPAFLGLELGAQAAAAIEAVERAAVTGTPAPAPGNLVRVREATFLDAHLPVEATIHVTAELEGAAPPVAIYGIEVRVEERVIVRAVLTTYAGSPADHDRTGHDAR